VTSVIDGKRLFVMPGLIDCHTHLHSVPGSVFRADSPQAIRTQQLALLRAYLAAGVTTVLDAAAPESLFIEMREIEKC
jgi:imidazolonepropionase-like amidohydrolase